MESCFEYITSAAKPGNAVSYEEFVKGVPKLYKCSFKPNTQDETNEDDLADAADIEEKEQQQEEQQQNEEQQQESTSSIDEKKD